MVKSICLRCLKVFSGKPTCCGEVAEFDPTKHGELLVSGSNGWANIAKAAERWATHPLYQKVWKERAAAGNFGHSTTIIQFVDELIEGGPTPAPPIDLVAEAQKRFKGLTKDEAFDVLWGATSFPFKEDTEVLKELSRIAILSGGDAIKAAKLVWDSVVAANRTPPEPPTT